MATAVRETRWMESDNGKRFKAEQVTPDELNPGDRVFYHSHIDGCVEVAFIGQSSAPSEVYPGTTVNYRHVYGNWDNWGYVESWKVRVDGVTFSRIIEESAPVTR
jgi:hypothetical protein